MKKVSVVFVAGLCFSGSATAGKKSKKPWRSHFTCFREKRKQVVTPKIDNQVESPLAKQRREKQERRISAIEQFLISQHKSLATINSNINGSNARVGLLLGKLEQLEQQNRALRAKNTKLADDNAAHVRQLGYYGVSVERQDKRRNSVANSRGTSEEDLEEPLTYLYNTTS